MLLKASINNERGVSIMEFALVLPLFILLISGSIDISTRVNSKNNINAAARQAAIAASSFTYGFASSCPLVADGFQKYNLGSCPDEPVTEVISPEMEETLTMNQLIRIRSCNYLKENGFSGSNWDVFTEIGHRNSNGVLFPIVRVQLKEKKADCLICYKRFSDLVSVDATATQGLEGCPSS